MSVRVTIPLPLRKLTRGKAEAEAGPGRLGEVIAALDRLYPGFQAAILDGDNRVHRYYHLYKNDEDIRTLDHLDTRLEDGDNLTIIPAIGGG